MCLSGKCLNAFNEFIQDKIRAGGGIGAHMQSHVLIDIYRGGDGGCVCGSTSRLHGGRKKRPRDTNESKKVSSVCDPCNSSASTSRESPYYSGLLSFTSRKREEIGKGTCTWYYILFFFWGAISRVKGDKRWECRRTFPSPPPCWAFQCKCTCLAQ